ncbi:MAG: cytochrome c maturation protein CcmE [Armatimonadetes bacterium]|nr:cytochrome c maturation protein CcmE [Anaerolineae bacterium]
MTQPTWEKSTDTRAAQQQITRLTARRGERLKFMVGGLLIIGAIMYLVASGTLTGQRFFITVNEVVGESQYAGQAVRITGAVLGETITETTNPDGTTLLTFTIAHVPTRTDNLAEALHVAVNDTTAQRLQVSVINQPRPELLRHEAQAILTGKLDAQGVFHADELQFKCPSRFEDAGPKMGEQDHPGMQSSGLSTPAS